MASLRLVSLDLDGTLIHPAIFNVVAETLGFGEPLKKSYRAYLAGELSLEAAFHHDYAYFVGRPVADMHAALEATDPWTPGIAEAVKRFHAVGARVVVTTDQPRFLAEATTRFGIDDLVCSEADVEAGVVTARVRPEFQKWPNLACHLEAMGIHPSEVAHVGNGLNDVPVFKAVGRSVAVNAEKGEVAQAATHAIPRLGNLGEVADILIQ